MTTRARARPSFVRRREGQGKDAAARLARSIDHSAAVLLDDAPDDVEAEARPRARMAAAEPFEERRAALFGNAEAVVFDAEGNRFVRRVSLAPSRGRRAALRRARWRADSPSRAEVRAGRRAPAAADARDPRAGAIPLISATGRSSATIRSTRSLQSISSRNVETSPASYRATSSSVSTMRR